MRDIWIVLGKLHGFFYVLHLIANGLVFNTYMLLGLTVLCFVSAQVCVSYENKLARKQL